MEDAAWGRWLLLRLLVGGGEGQEGVPPLVHGGGSGRVGRGEGKEVRGKAAEGGVDGGGGEEVVVEAEGAEGGEAGQEGLEDAGAFEHVVGCVWCRVRCVGVK